MIDITFLDVVTIYFTFGLIIATVVLLTAEIKPWLQFFLHIFFWLPMLIAIYIETKRTRDKINRMTR